MCVCVHGNVVAMCDCVHVCVSITVESPTCSLCLILQNISTKIQNNLNCTIQKIHKLFQGPEFERQIKKMLLLLKKK